MKKIFASALLVLMAATAGFSAPPRGGAGGGRSGPGAAPAAAPAASNSARAASLNAPKPSAPMAAPKTGGAPKANNARAAQLGGMKAPAPSGGAAGARGGANSARAASTNAVVGAPKATAARAAATSVVKTGSAKIASSAASTEGIVDEACKGKYFGCMDSFCMQDNANGARCVCSDQVNSYNTILEEIEKLDFQSQKLATDGVDRITMGQSAEEVEKMVADAAEKLDNAELMKVKVEQEQGKKKKKLRAALDLSAFDNFGGDDEQEDMVVRQQDLELEADPLAGLTGDAFHSGVRGICVKQIQDGCEKDMKLLQMMYSAQIKNDCSGYELELKRRRTASAAKLQAAQRAMKEAALEQFEEQNKWDLGQCVTELQKCMATTGGCGEDFAQCTYFNRGQGLGGDPNALVTVEGSTINVHAGTIDTINANRGMCEPSVTKFCVAVKDQVWTTFIARIAPALKSAEVIAEASHRQKRLENISQCFIDACNSEKLSLPGDNDGFAQANSSYDACLSNPINMANSCKEVLERSGMPTGGTALENDPLWVYVKAKLGAMRIDACTSAVKKIMQSDKMCSEDYLGCLGMGLLDIQRMIPNESLTSCAKDGQPVTDADWLAGGKIGTIVEMLMMNLDNGLLEVCEGLAMESFTKICMGNDSDSAGVSTCDKPFDDNFGTKSLKLSMDAGARTAKVEGLVDFAKISYSTTGAETETLGKITNSYPSMTTTITDTIMKPHFDVLKTDIDAVIQRMITINPRLAFCTEGRDMSQIKARSAPPAAGPGNNNNSSNLPDRTKTEARFPRLLDPYVTVLVQAGISHAKVNYDKKLKTMFDEAKASLKPKSGGIIDGNTCWMENPAE